MLQPNSISHSIMEFNLFFVCSSLYYREKNRVGLDIFTPYLLLEFYIRDALKPNPSGPTCLIVLKTYRQIDKSWFCINLRFLFSSSYNLLKSKVSIVI